VTALAVGRRAALEAVRSGRALEVLVSGSARETPGLREVLEAARGAGIAVRRVAREELDRLAADHRGVVARVARAEEPGERELARWPFGPEDLVVVLDGVADPQNLGAAARTAEAAGAAMLVSRLRRAAPVTATAVRASAGALLHLPHARVANLPRALRRLQDAGFTVAGLDHRAARTIYEEPCPAGRLALVVGSEGAGISRLVRETCDLLVALPMRGRVGSLNASAALAAALYGWVLPPRSGARLGPEAGVAQPGSASDL
jgi:23S rRNA (guanosine2251-2'-O)-methyltransferase